MNERKQSLRKEIVRLALVFSHFFHGRFIVYEVIFSSNDFFHNVNVSSSCYYLPVMIDFSVFA